MAKAGERRNGFRFLAFCVLGVAVVDVGVKRVAGATNF